MAAARNPGPDLLPLLLLGGLAVYLLLRQRQAMASPSLAQAQANRDAERLRAIGNAATGFFAWLGGRDDGNHSSARPTEAALDQVVDAARVWQDTYGELAGADGDPYY